MDKFISNLTGGGDKNNNNKQQKKKDAANNSSWQGGRSGDMNSLNKKSSFGSGSIGGGGGKGGSDSGSKGSGSGGNNAGNANIFANAGAGINDALGKWDLFNANKKSGRNVNSRGGGQSLGGAQPGVVLSVSLDQPGPLGMEIERRKNAMGTTIISLIVPNSQADKAGLKRGDIVCHAGSNGEEEIKYEQFLAVAKSGKRPLKFDIRRIESSLVGGSSASQTATNTKGGRASADAFARKQAVIAAAEAREAKYKSQTKAIPKTAPLDKLRPKQPAQEQIQHEVDSEETRRAVAAIKQAEIDDATNLGYNPYESKAMTSGQARTATVAMTQGEINADNAPSKLGGGRDEAGTKAPGRVNRPAEPAARENSQPQELSGIVLDPAFEHAFATLVTSNPNNTAVLKSIGIMRKLIVNATTKGQQGNLDDESSSKFRRVRLSNPKIKEAITDLSGALELMMSVGFLLSENDTDGETYLVYPPGENGPDWLVGALARLEEYENGGSKV